MTSLILGVGIGICLMTLGLCFRFRYYADEEARADVIGSIRSFLWDLLKSVQ